MSYITEIPPDESDGKLARVYKQLAGSRGKVSNIMSVQSLLPDAMKAHLDLYLAVMFRDTGLSREEREMIAVVVSHANECAYCVNHHAEALREYWPNDRVEAFTSDPAGFDLPERDHAMVAYALKLTTTPGEMVEDDVRHLRAVGLDDQQILSVNMAVGYFNFVNRIAVGLGVEFTPDELSGYRAEVDE
jgi:uncharacterized peroxidase-related enzyme